MILNYAAMEEKAIPNFKGGEGTLYACPGGDSANKILKVRLPLGSTIGMHAHETDSEVMFVVSGTADHTIDGVVEKVGPDMCMYCPKGSAHSIVTTSQEDLVFYAVMPQQQ